MRFVADLVGEVARAAVAAARPGDVLLLENLRFDKGEEGNDPAFCAALRALADVYVNDAFGTAHRAHASTAGVAQLFAERAAGPLMAREIHALSKVRDDPARPFVAVVGGAKISGKLETLQSLASLADTLVLVGGMANTFLLAQGVQVGRSLVEADLVDTAREILAAAAARGATVVLPADVVVASGLDAPGRVVPVAAVGPDDMILDIGPVARTAIAGVARRRAHRVLERPGRRLRKGGVRRRHSGDRPGHGRVDRVHGRRRRRVGGRGAAGRGRGPARARLHGRRRLAGVPRRRWSCPASPS